MKLKNKSKETLQAESVKSNKEIFQSNKLVYLLLGLALLLSLIAYIPAFSAGFVNWDDQDYVMNNQIIRSFSDFGKFFTTTVQGNYHPLTMLSLALNYAISGDNANSYHALNILFHLLNVLLVYFFILKLFPGNLFIAFTTAILFGVHPMHVESVAWVSERKDVLYSFFFLLGLIQYLRYLESPSKKQFIYTLLWFILSIASKPAAIVFPLVLFLLDFFKGRKFSWPSVLEKTPFFLLAIVLIFITTYYQKAIGATPLVTIYAFEKRMFFPFYGYMMYFFKMLWPMNLCTFYPFPPINEELSKAYLLSPLFFLSSVYLCFKTRNRYPVITFGIAFYFINLLLILQFFMFGSAIIADRYTYIPFIGLFVILAWYLDEYLKLSKKTAYSIIIGISLLLTFLSYKQSETWTSTASLWDNAIEKHPSAKAYANRAYLYQQDGKFDKAIELYNKSRLLNIDNREVYFNLAVIYFHQNKDSLSLINYNQALQLKPDYVDALNGRGSLYARQGKSELALADFEKLRQIDPNYDAAYKNKAASYFKEGNYEMAIESYKEYLNIRKNDAEAYANLGVAYLNKGDNEQAIKACEQAIAIDPKFAKAYINMGAAYINLKQFPKAIEHLNVSFKIDSSNEENLKFLSLCYLNLGDTAKALSFFEIANRINAK